MITMHTSTKHIINTLPEGYTEVRYRNRPRGLTKEIFNEGKSTKIYASELGGDDYISLNRYETAKKDYLKPCEMPEHKVTDFLFGLQLPEMRNIPIDAQDTLICGLGCFRGVQAQFDKQPGVLDTEVGYAGGTKIQHPSYDNIVDYSEAVKVKFDPTVTSFNKLVDFIFAYKDPTFKASKNQYRYAIRYLDEVQKKIIEDTITQAQAGYTGRPIALAALEHTHFERAEEYHQKYFAKHDVKGDACAV